MAKKKNEHLGRRKKRFTPEQMEAMFIDFINERSLTDIAKEYGITKQNLNYYAKKEKWYERRDAIIEKVSQEIDYKLVEQLAHSKEKQIEAVGMMFATIYNDIKEDYENQKNPSYVRKFKINSVIDLDRVVKTLYFILNNGMEVSGVKDVGDSDNPDKASFSQSEKQNILKALANRLITVKDEDAGTA